MSGALAGALAGFLVRDLGLAEAVSYHGDRVVFPMLGALLGWALQWTPLRSVLAATVTALAALWMCVVCTPLSAWMAEGLARRDPLRPADAVFVFASRLQADGDPTSVAASRLLHGLELLARGQAPCLVLSELRPPSTSYALLARQWMETLGIQGDVLTVGPIGSTREEAVAVASLLRARGWRRLLVVTSPTHSRRACGSIEREGAEVVCSPAIETGFDMETLDRWDERLMAFGVILHERVGIWYYCNRGWMGDRPTSR